MACCLEVLLQLLRLDRSNLIRTLTFSLTVTVAKGNDGICEGALMWLCNLFMRNAAEADLKTETCVGQLQVVGKSVHPKVVW